MTFRERSPSCRCRPSPRALLCCLACGLLAGSALRAQDTPLELPGLPKSSWFLLAARSEQAPARGNGLLVVLPGGTGTADFLPWVRDGILAQAPDDFLCAMLTAPKWNAGQKVVWPTAASKEPGMRYTTEDYVRAVVKEVGGKHKLDPARTIVLAWSSSGPAVWQLLMSADNPFERAYVAMSVFAPQDKQALARSKGLRVLLDQSPEDTTTPFAHAEQARAALTANGAIARLVSYHGGHGWNDDPQSRIREGLRWLLSTEPAPPVQPAAVGTNLLKNGGFEQGDQGWSMVSNTGTLRAEKDAREHKEGKASLHLVKTGKVPLDLIKQQVPLPDTGRATARAWVRCKGAGNAFVKFFVYDANDQVLHQDVDLVHLSGDAGWQQVEKTLDLKGASYGVLQVVLVLGGEVWIDGAEVIASR